MALVSEIDTKQAENQGKKYKETALKVDQWLILHKGESFTLDLICRQLNITNPESRHDVVKKLAYEVSKGVVEKSNPPYPPSIYSYHDNTIKIIDWVNAPETVSLPIQLPQSHVDNSRFGFNGNVTIAAGDIFIVAGVSNTGKTAYALNLLCENMNIFPCTLMGNEYGNGSKFRDRLSKMEWAKPLNEKGQPKFELIERRGGWKDVIRPDNLNIIDWLMVPDNFYQIGDIIDGIQSKLRKGIAVILIQKDPFKDMGVGGMFGEHLASFYLAMDFNRLTVKKAKAWNNGYDPNKKMYAFSLSMKGTAFSDIREVNPCKKCHGSGKVGKDGATCLECVGTGYSDVEAQ